MKKSIIILNCLILFLMLSCKNIYYSGNNLDPSINFIGTSNASLDLYVDTTRLLKGSSTTTITLGIFKSSDNVYSDAYIGGIADLEKRAAMYKALQNTNYDLIVLPKYKIELYKGLFIKKTTCFVEGYGGKYKLKNVKYISENYQSKNNSISTENINVRNNNTDKNNSVDIPINQEEPIYTKLQSIKNDINIKVVDYKNLSEVSVGDYVQASTSRGDFLYGEVVEILSMNKIKVRLEPTPKTIVYNEFDFKKCKKVIVD